MSLQVWLPLIKDYENYGLSELKFANFRYIRFVINAIKGGSDSYTQLSRLEFLDAEGNLFKYPAGTTVSSSMTGYPANEPPASIIDGNVNTKFCAPWSAGGYLTVALGSSETIDISRYSHFQWYTANDGEWRDPISFEVQFSNDGTNFIKGAVVTNASITSSRYTLAYTGNCFNASAGKMGPSCYYNNSYELGGLYSDKKINLGNKLSMCCWVNFSALNPNSALGGSMGGQHRYPNCTGMGLTIKYISNSTGYLSCNTGDGNGNRTYNTYCGNTLLSAGVWYHVVFTYDGSTIKFYVNGKFDGSHSYTAQKNVEDYVFLGAWSFELGTDSPTIYGNYKLNGKINDFRIYDHVLSKKEIKLLSQGLVAHYQLKGMGSTNYLKGAGKFLKDTPLVRNASDVSHMNDSYVYHEWSPNDIFAVLPSAGTYTFSTESDGIGASHPTSGTTASQRLFSLWLQNTSSGGHYHFAMSKGADGRWYGTRTDLVAGTYKVRTNLYAADNVNYTVKFWNMKVTAGNYTPSDTWCPHEEDELYTSLGLGSVVGTDCSGYGNNLEQVGTIPIESDSARFGSCVNYNNSGYLRKSDFGLTTNTFTIAFWLNPPYSINAQHFICGTFNGWTGNGFGMWRDSTGGGYSLLYKSNSEGSHTGFPTVTPTHDIWNHIAIVYTGTQGIVYLNGAEVARVDGGSNGTVFHPVLYLGNSRYNEVASQTDEASMSDFRFYATALSAEDIADLYKNSASVSRDGTLFAYDFHENKRNSIDRDGIVATGGFSYKSVPTYDMKIKMLGDGTTWARIHHLDASVSKDWFANDAEVAKCTDKHNRYSRMGIVDRYKVGSEYEFMLTYPSIKKTLPSGYTQLEYIEATGTQWINTGVTGHARWEFDIQFTNTTKRQLMGYWGNQDEYWGCQTDGKYGLFAGSTIGKAGGRDTIVHDFQQGAATLWTQNQTLGIGGNATLGSNQYQLFNIMSANYACHAKLWRCKCVQSGALIRDFVPARRNSDGYIGLFDMVNNVFYGNSGSGSFVANGAPISPYIELYNRWIQTSSPNASPNTGTGFKALTTSFTSYFTPITKSASSGSAVYSMNTSNNWWAPIGQKVTYNNGIPAADGSTQYETELWVRIDKSADATKASMYDGSIAATNFIEL